MTESELRTLCRDRELVTPELHESNDFYGHATVLKRYAGLPARSSLKLAVEHGVILNDYVWDVDVAAGLPMFLCASPRRAALFAAKSPARAVPIGPLTHYVPRPGAPSRRVLLAFPSHSSHRVKTVFDAGAFADRLAAIGKAFDDVHVCVYWRDVQSGLDRTFRERGFQCVSAGHMFDAAFLPRLLDVIAGAAAVVTNEVGSSLLYAALANKPVWIERQHVEYVAPADVLAVDTPDHVDHPNVRRLEALFAEPTDVVSPTQREFVDELCGIEHVKTPAELARLVSEAEACYRQQRTLVRRAREVARKLQYARALVKQELKNRWP